MAAGARTYIALCVEALSSMPQFYRCFLILFHCNGRAAKHNGLSSLPSRTTTIHLKRRVYSNTVACAGQLSSGNPKKCHSTPATQRISPPVIPS